MTPPPASYRFSSQRYLVLLARTAFLVGAILFGLPFALGQTSGNAQGSNAQQPTWGQLQQQINDLNDDLGTVDSFLKKNAQQIFGHTYEGLNSGVEATVGSLFMRTAEFNNIQKTILDAEAAAKNAHLLFDQSQDAAKSGQQDLALQQQVQAVKSASDAAAKLKDAFEQTTAVFKRIGTGDVDPQRFWEGRKDFANSFSELAKVGKAMDEGEALIQLRHSLNTKIAQLQEQQRFAPYEHPSLPSASGSSNGPPLPFDPTKLTATERAAWLKNQGIVGAETSALSSKSPGGSLPSGWQFNPDVLSDKEKQAWLKNQSIIGSETATLSGKGGGTSLPNGWQFNPDNFSPQEKAGWLTNQEKMRNETFAHSQSADLLDSISGTDTFGYPTSTRQSADGRLSAVTQLSFRNAGGVWPQSIVKWAVYDHGQFVGAYDSDVNLLDNGKYQVLTTPGAMGIMAPDGKPRAPVYTTYDAGLEVQNQQFAQANADTLRNSGYRETQAFGGGVYAASKGTNGWDVLDSQGNKLGDGGYAQTKDLGGGVVAASRDLGSGTWDVYNPAGEKIASGYHQLKPLVGGTFAASRDYFGGSWEVLDPSGHHLGDGSYSDVEVQGGQIAAWKQLGGGSPTYLAPTPVNSVINSVSSPIRQTAVPTPATGGINLGGQQTYTTTKGLEAQADKELKDAEVVPPKKKKP